MLTNEERQKQQEQIEKSLAEPAEGQYESFMHKRAKARQQKKANKMPMQIGSYRFKSKR